MGLCLSFNGRLSASWSWELSLAYGWEPCPAWGDYRAGPGFAVYVRHGSGFRLRPAHSDPGRNFDERHDHCRNAGRSGNGSRTSNSPRWSSPGEAGVFTLPELLDLALRDKRISDVPPQQGAGLLYRVRRAYRGLDRRHARCQSFAGLCGGGAGTLRKTLKGFAAPDFTRATAFFAWCSAVIALAPIVGQQVTLIGFFFLYLVVWGGFQWYWAALYAAVSWLFMYALYERLLHVAWMPSSLFG
jgi:hypothetical protein